MDLLIKEIFEGKEYEEIRDTLIKVLEDSYEEKMSQLTPEQRSEVQRVLYLQVLDPQWRDHLYEMDVLKTGIGLRGYNQKDPLTEYKKDSYNLFMQLIDRIKREAIETLQLVQFNFESPEEEQRRMEAILDELESELENAKTNEEEIVSADVEGGGNPNSKAQSEVKRNRSEMSRAMWKWPRSLTGLWKSGTQRAFGLTWEPKTLPKGNPTYLKMAKENPYLYQGGAFWGTRPG